MIFTCLVIGNSESFKLNIKKEKDFIDLRKSIKEKKQNDFDVDAEGLILWKVNIPNIDDQNNKLRLINNNLYIDMKKLEAEKLPPSGEIQAYFPVQPDKNQIHIIIFHDEVAELAKRCNLDVAQVPKYLKNNSKLLLEVTNRMKVGDSAWVIQWNDPFHRNNRNQTKASIITHITNPRWKGVNEFGRNIIFTFCSGSMLSECESALPEWTRRQDGMVDVGISFRINKISNKRTDLERFDHPFNR